MRLTRSILFAGGILLASMSPSSALDLEHHDRGRAEPRPIPGGAQIPGGPFIHLFLPGPASIGHQGIQVEPSVITDFKGFTAVGFLHGRAHDGHGNPLDMDVDIRVFDGEYIAADGSRNHGTFGFI